MKRTLIPFVCLFLSFLILPRFAVARTAEQASAAGTAGASVLFGRYEQDHDEANGPEPIEWIVLDAQKGKSLLLSRYALDAVPYNEWWENLSWDRCTLRTWLNETFLNAAFTASEQKAVLQTKLKAIGGGHEGYPKAKDTKDRVFLLSRDEGLKYFGDEESAWRCEPTLYARTRGAMFGDESVQDRVWAVAPGGAGCCEWWLRAPGPDADVQVVLAWGRHLEDEHADIYETHIGVRPAVWVNTKELSSLTEEAPLPMPASTPFPGTVDAGSVPVSMDAQAGDHVLFGTYEQDNDLSNGPEPIEWIVLDSTGKEAVLISRYGLDNMHIRREREHAEWSNSDMRSWLNGTFLDAAFTAQERGALLASDFPDSVNGSGRDEVSGDLVYLLSSAEAAGYFSSDAERKCFPTRYAVSHKVFIGEGMIDEKDGCRWWLRTGTAYYGEEYFSYVKASGAIDTEYGFNASHWGIAVRPVIRVDLGKAAG